jgi:hypothetical protein
MPDAVNGLALSRVCLINKHIFWWQGSSIDVYHPSFSPFSLYNKGKREGKRENDGWWTLYVYGTSLFLFLCQGKSLVLLAQYLPGKAIGQGRRLITEHWRHIGSVACRSVETSLASLPWQIRPLDRRLGLATHFIFVVLSFPFLLKEKGETS